MMSDPKRYLSTTGDEHGIERSLLRGLRDVAAPPHAKAETWTRLQTQLAATAVVTAGAVAAQSVGGAAPGSAAGAGVVSTPTGLATSGVLRTVAIKLGLGVLVAGSMTVGAVALWPRATPVMTSRTMAPARSVPAPVVAPRAPDPRTLPAPVTENPGAAPIAQPDSRPTRPRRPEAVITPDPLSVEAAMITRARAQLRGGDAPAALSTLSRLRSRARNGALAQERELLTIQALSALGQTEAARRRARAFVASYPDSPHASLVRGIAHGP
jgi:hypothetical protein